MADSILRPAPAHDSSPRGLIPRRKNMTEYLITHDTISFFLILGALKGGEPCCIITRFTILTSTMTILMTDDCPRDVLAGDLGRHSGVFPLHS